MDGMIGSDPVATHDVLGCVAHAADLDNARPRQPPLTANQRDAIVFKPRSWPASE